MQPNFFLVCEKVCKVGNFLHAKCISHENFFWFVKKFAKLETFCTPTKCISHENFFLVCEKVLQSEKHFCTPKCTRESSHNLRNVYEKKTQSVTLDRPVLVANLEPGVRKLRLVKCDGPTLHCISHLHLRELSLDPISDLRWDALMPLQSLRVLRVGLNGHVLTKKLFAIRSSDFLCLPELQSLTLSHCRFSRGAIEQLRILTTLKHFALFSSCLDDVRLGELASLTMLEELDLSWCYLPQVTRLSRLPLRRLDVSNSGLTNDQVLSMCNTDTLESLTVSQVEIMNPSFTSHFKKLSTITINYEESRRLVMRLNQAGKWCEEKNT